MEKAVKIAHLKDRNTDFQYWMLGSETERLEAIETLRSQFVNYKDVKPRLQRVCRAVNQKQS